MLKYFALPKLLDTICSLSRDKGRDPRTFTQYDIYESMNFVVNRTDALPKGLTINKVADAWIDQERLPLVTVTRNYDNGTITFSQVLA